MSEPFDTLQDARAEHNLETGDCLSLDEYIRQCKPFLSSPAPARSDAAGFPAEPAEAPQARTALPLDDNRGPLLPVRADGALSHHPSE